MKLTITGKIETIIGIMRKLDICDAKFNINEGFSINLDDVPEQDDKEQISTTEDKGRRKSLKYPHIKTGINPDTITTLK